MTQQRSTSGNLELELLEAAAALGEVQFADLRNARRMQSALNKCISANKEFAESEFELCAVELAYAQARHHFMVCQRKVEELEPQMQNHRVACGQARLHLWTVASSGNRDLLLEAASRYGDASRAYGGFHQLLANAKGYCFLAQKSVELADEARQAAVQERDRAKICAEAAERDRAQVFQADSGTSNLFVLEAELVDAAHRFTGTMGDRYACSFVDTAKLAITLPEDQLG